MGKILIAVDEVADAYLYSLTYWESFIKDIY